jgi:hypothetical protein
VHRQLLGLPQAKVLIRIPVCHITPP